MTTPTDTSTEAARRQMGFTSYSEVYGQLSALWELASDVLYQRRQGLISAEEAEDFLTHYANRAKQIQNCFSHQQ